MSEILRGEIVDRLNTIAGVQLPPGARDERRSMPLSAFVDADSRAALLDVLHGVVAGLRAGDVPKAAGDGSGVTAAHEGDGVDTDGSLDRR